MGKFKGVKGLDDVACVICGREIIFNDPVMDKICVSCKQ